jgi:hypothetical protein
MSSQSPASLIAFHPVLLCHAFSLKYPDLLRAGFRYIKIVGKLKPSGLRKLIGISQQLLLQERLNPSFSSLQLLSRVQAAVSSAGVYFSPYAGGDVAEMAVIIILMMVQDGDQDLQEQMLEAQAQMAAKQALRTLINEYDRLQVAVAAGAQSSKAVSAAAARIGLPLWSRSIQPRFAR